MAIPRKTMLSVHVCLASFLLPFAVMFVVTGALYTVSVKGGSESTEHSVEVSAPLEPQLDDLEATARAALADLGEKEPSGEPSLRRAGTSFQLEWAGVARDVVLAPAAEEGTAVLIIKENGPYRWFVQLHKAKGSAIARAVSVAWALGLLVVLASGMAMAWGAPRHKRMALASAGVGAAAFLAYFLLG